MVTFNNNEPSPKRSGLDIDALMQRLSPLEKAKMLGGGSFWTTCALPAHNIPSITMGDGPSGARSTALFNPVASNLFPSGIGLGSTFDVELMRDIGSQQVLESRSKNLHVLLGPTINIARSVLGGRAFECYSEDPYLSGMLAGSYVKSIQSGGVGACLKHFVCNEQEYEKHVTTSVMSERAFREIYLEPFRIANKLESPWMYMTAYNPMDGVHCSENKQLLTGILREEWGYDGTVISDWSGTHSTVESIKAGLDLEMPGPAVYRAPAQVLDLIRADKLTQKDVDASVRNVLKVVDKAMQSGIEFESGPYAIDTPATRKLLRHAAASAVVLLRNDKAKLPIKASRGTRIAVIGPNANEAFTSGGGSASAPLETFTNTPLQGIRQAAEAIGATVSFAQGIQTSIYIPLADPYLTRSSEGKVGKVEFWKKEPPSWKLPIAYTTKYCTPAHAHQAYSTFCQILDSVPEDILEEGRFVRYTATMTPDKDGDWLFGVVSIDEGLFFVDGKLVIDYTKDLVQGTHFFGFALEEKTAVVPHLKTGKSVELELRLWDSGRVSSLPSLVPASFQIGVMPVLEEESGIQEAVDLAKKSDVTIVMVGLSKDFETEGYDRLDYGLPGASDRLVEAVLKAQPGAIIVNQSGMPVAMPWEFKADTIVQAFYGGTSGGDGLADILFGKVNPSARLPISFPRRAADCLGSVGFANRAPTYGKVFYHDDIYVGYRHYDKDDIDPLFAFGHGLSYTTFDYLKLQITQEGESMQVAVTVKNSGQLAGNEVVQVYVSFLTSSVATPVKELKGFTKIPLQPGETNTVIITLDRDAFKFWDVKSSHWVMEKGDYKIIAARSSKDLCLEEVIHISKTESWRGL